MDQAEAAEQRLTFERPFGQIVLTLIAAPIGAAGFLLIAGAMLVGAFGVDPLTRIFAALGFGFFGVMLGLGSLSALRRGFERRLIEITPTEFWLQATGWQSWDAVAEVRLEGHRGVASADRPVTTSYRRLGFTLRDASIRPPAEEALGWAIDRALRGFVRRSAPDVRFRATDAAPFGVAAVESGGRFDEIVEAVAAHVEIVDAVARRARENALQFSHPSRRAAGPAVLTEAEIRSIDAGLAVPRPGRPERDASDATPPAPLVVEPVAPPAPSATFDYREVGVGTVIAVLRGLTPFVFIALVTLGAAVSWLANGAATGFALFLIAWIAIAAGFARPSLAVLVHEIRRWRDRDDGPALTVGPDGIRFPGADTTAWDDVTEIRVERAGFTATNPQLERWRLAVRRRDPFAQASDTLGTIESDELDTPFDDVLDLIRFYHPVIDTD